MIIHVAKHHSQRKDCATCFALPTSFFDQGCCRGFSKQLLLSPGLLLDTPAVIRLLLAARAANAAP